MLCNRREQLVANFCVIFTLQINFETASREEDSGERARCLLASIKLGNNSAGMSKSNMIIIIGDNRALKTKSTLTSWVRSCKLSFLVDNFAFHSGSLDRIGRRVSDYSAAPSDYC